jgi:hypothetical protein
MVNNALKLRKVKARKAHLGMYCGSLLEEDFSLTDRSDAACCVLRAACCVLRAVLCESIACVARNQYG